VNPKASVILELPREASARAIVCARAAARYEECGDYERAIDTLSQFWRGDLERPNVRGLNDEAKAALLLRVGSLTAWVGSKRQLEGWQEAAKNLLSESADLSEAVDVEAWLNARKHLALCYWREGNFDEARAIVTVALGRAPSESEPELSLKLVLGLIERSQGHYNEALRLHQAIAAQVEHAGSDFLSAMFHNGLGLTFRNLGETDRGIIELTAAAYYFTRLNHQRYLMANEINVGNLLVQASQFDDAHLHFDRAERLAGELRDLVHLAHTKDSRALAYLKEKKYEAAEREARAAVTILEKGDEHGLLVDFLLNHALALEGLRSSETLPVLLRAYQIASESISSERAAQIVLRILGTLAGQACSDGQLTWDEATKRFESSVIQAALLEASGSITAAALRLGMKQQTLSWMIQNHHPDLQPKTRKRRRTSLLTPVASKTAKP
jgi:tetratricopeptide (TPR) repeat protein